MLETVKRFFEKSITFVVKWRYLLALIAFVFCVAFNLHGSSIAIFNNYFTDSNIDEYNSESVVLGTPRSIRSDEYMVHTPYYMSQTYNNFEKDSNMMSLEGQDMIVGYNAPVFDITALGKPFTWGYFIFGNERGLSWYWCSKLILLVLVTFELCLIITRGNKKISLFGTILIVFSPLVQWWFVPHIVDVLFWGMALLVLAYHFFTSEGWKRIMCMILLALSAVTFVLALFPSLQVPITFVDIALLVAFLVRDRKQITFRKKDIWRIVAMACYAGGVLAYTIITSKDAILTLHDTVYPGSRVSLGGGSGLEGLFTGLTTFTLPFKSINYSNNCEASRFIHFAPLLFMLYPVIYKKFKRDKNLIVGNVLLVCLAVMAVFMCIGFPELLAKVTLLSYSNRMYIIYGFVATLFTIWGISMIWKKKIFSKKQIIIALAVFALLNVCFVNAQKLTYLTWWQYGFIIAGLTFLGFLMVTNKKKLFTLFTSVLIVVSGMTVNPIAYGTSPLTSHPLEQKIQEIAREDSDAYWLAINSTGFAALGIMNGARFLNAVNFYPDFEKWELIDPDGEQKDVYNRYAHIAVRATGGETKFNKAQTADAFILDLSAEDSLKWSVEYLVTAGELNEKWLNYYEKIYDDPEGDHYIYKRKDFAQ